jgi:hypothetical protein
VWGGSYFPSDAVPPRLRDATIELARELLKADRTLDSDVKGISRIGIVQAIDVTFTGDAGDRPQIFTDLIRAMLQPFGSNRQRRSMARVRRG